MYKSMLSQKASLWFCHNFSHVLFLSRSKAVFYQSCERPEVYAWQAKPPAFKTTTTKKLPSVCSKKSMEIYILNQ